MFTVYWSCHEPSVINVVNIDIKTRTMLQCYNVTLREVDEL